MTIDKSDNSFYQLENLFNGVAFVPQLGKMGIRFFLVLKWRILSMKY